MFQSPRNRVNTSNTRKDRLYESQEAFLFQSPRNRVNTSNKALSEAQKDTPEQRFNPLEIGSTLQMFRKGGYRFGANGR